MVDVHKIMVSADVVLKMIDYVATHGEAGVAAIKDLIEDFNKNEITAEDWDELDSVWDKTPEDFLAEARERLAKK